MYTGESLVVPSLERIKSANEHLVPRERIITEVK
jgi:hypothetical protein